MDKRGIVLGFFQDQNAALEILQIIRRNWHHRSALIHKDHSGKITVNDYDVSLIRAALWGSLGGLLAGLIVTHFFHEPIYAIKSLSTFVILIAFCLFGSIVGAILSIILDFGIPDSVIAHYKNLIVRNETLIIVHVVPRKMGRILDLLRETSTGSPITFAFHPERRADIGTGRQYRRTSPLSLRRLRAAARRLALALHAVSPVGTHGKHLTQQLSHSEREIRQVQELLAHGSRIGRTVSLSAEWLLDNAYIVQEHVDDIRRNLPKRYFEELPIIAEGENAGLPRSYCIASELVDDTDCRLDRDNILSFLESYQNVTPLTMGELWAIPLMLRLRIIETIMRLATQVERRELEREQADFWANRLLTAARRDPDRLQPFVAALTLDMRNPTANLVDQLMGYLYDEEVALSAVRGWLEQMLNAPLQEAIQQEHIDQTSEQVTLSNGIMSLQRFSHLDWREPFEALSQIDVILRSDPARIYSQMDFATRDRYRHSVEEIARGSKIDEFEAARQAIELANGGEGLRSRHVGYYLIDQGRETLEAKAGSKPTRARLARRWARRNSAAIYLGSIAALTIAQVAILVAISALYGIGLAQFVVLGSLALLPASDIAVQLTNYLVTRIMPPESFPRMSFEEGIPDNQKTLVVVPMMLLTPESIREEVQHLEIRYLANPDPNLRYGLISDFSDAPQKEMPDDVERLDVVVHGIEALNARYGSGLFFLFHRERNWSESEARWIGWERKRGKLEQLNRFLLGAKSSELDNLLHIGDPERLRDIRYVITLDCDTQLPRDSARRMVETIAHPLNQAQISADGRKVERGFTIIQPRVSTSLPSSNQTLFARIFSDATGTDPYTQAISDVYQDLAGEGSYHGKGIYDLAAFDRILSGRFPEAHLLSHDLIEGAHARCGLASDIELLDLYPKDYVVYSSRQHRWVRGDWQIADWLLPTVPAPGGRREANPLIILNRWKIADNLRRSLMPVSLTAFLAFGWLLSPAPALVSLFVACVLLMPVLILLATKMTTRPQPGGTFWKELGAILLRCAISTSLLPHQTALTLDAICRVLYRRLVSHRQLLEWETAQEAHRHSKNRQRQFVLSMLWIPAFFAAFALSMPFFIPLSERSAELFLALWIVCPILVVWLNSPIGDEHAQALGNSERQMLRQVARLTWRFFSDLVTPETNWLPPDNYQEFLRSEVAQRSSPTNIGLGLLSTLAAYDFGYVTVDGLIENTHETMRTIDKLERHEGHLLNWYNTLTLEPLWPRYVSMVDSGNLLADLWAMEQGFDEILSSPLINELALSGIEDTIGLLRQLQFAEGTKGVLLENPLRTFETALRAPVQDLDGMIRRIRTLSTMAGPLAKATHEHCSDNASCIYWAEQIEKQVGEWNALIDRYLSWVEILGSPPEGGLLTLGPDVHEWRRQAMVSAPSLNALASGDVTGLSGLVDLQRRSESMQLSDAMRVWLEAFAGAAANSMRLAVEQVAKAENVMSRMKMLADGMNMRFLYDPERRLFYTGYNVSERRMDSGHYNLLATEARLGSFVAIARGEIPVEHWWALARPYGTAFGERALLSWGGTMFEYLMPLLLTRSFENSMLDQACKSAVKCQIAYGRRRNIPWGISEAAFSGLDSHQIYQYRAFGVPGLGIKRGLEEDLVVTPYASALALAVAPEAAAKNLQRLSRLARLGMRGGYGYYEAVDYTRQHAPKGERGVIVYAYMAHHQGMILAAIDNVLNNGALQNRFHRNLWVRASESLLYERIPVSPPMAKSNVKKELVSRLTPLIAPPTTGRLETPHTPAPKTNLLSNGSYSIMVTNAGSGYSRWRDVEISRWRADPTSDDHGNYIYLKDLETGLIWSAGYQPTGVRPQRYSVVFTADKAEFRRRDSGIETLMEMVVSPEDNVEVRCLTLTNRSLRNRQIELTSYIELALAQHAADRAHPAFNKMFIQTEVLPEQGALLAWRRPRSSDEAPLWAVHVVASEAVPDIPIQFETDRARFLGRGKARANPEALTSELSNTDGAVLDPVFSLRRRIDLEPGERAMVAFVTGAAESRQVATAIAEEYGDLRAVRRALEMAWTHAQLELRHLRIQQDEAQRFQLLASHILYPNSLLRLTPERLARNTLGQSRLWAFGISGDLPIVAITIGDAQDIDLVRQVLMAHNFWRLRGLKVDLLILNEEGVSYNQPLHVMLRKLVEAHIEHGAIDHPGGVFLRPIGQIPEDERTLLLSVARVVLVAARGSLAQQLGAPISSALEPRLLSKNPRIREEPSPPLRFMELPYFNGLGGFTSDGREYAIYLGPGSQTPMPWINVMANPTFGAIVSESGAGFTWHGNSQSNRLTPWSNDPIGDPPGDAIYIRDEDLGVFWSPTPHPIREKDAYRARHGQGYTVFEHNSHAIEQELTTFVPVDADGGAPIRIQRLRLANRSSRRRRLTVVSYCEWVLGTDREETQMHVSTQWDAQDEILFARNRYNPDFGSNVAFAASNRRVGSCTGDRTGFLGRNGSVATPNALTRAYLSGSVGAGLDPCGAIQVSVELDPNQETEVLFLLGQEESAEEARLLVQQFRKDGVADQALRSTIDWWDDILGTVQVETPDLAVNFLMNRWLLYQDISCRLWGRSAFYQSGGAFGFRDQLQDVMALVYAAPQMAREQILRAAARQFVEGDVQHWWHLPSGAGVRTRISDDLLWLPFVTAHYVRVTGDLDILDEVIPFLEAKTLEQHEHEVYSVPSISKLEAGLLEHCRRAIARGMTSGPHGLPLIGSGDWNDGFNRVGIGGTGESVWLAWFLIHVLNDFAELLKLRGEVTEASDLSGRAGELAAAVEKHAWDGKWYRRAFFDDGSPLGSEECDEAQIDSIAQSWGVISRAAEPERAKAAMQAVMERLVLEDEKVVLLFTPPFDKSPKDPGYIKGYPPGVRENGGQYTHGSLWAPMALARLGQGDNAVSLLRMMNPIEHCRTPEDVVRYKVEPYAVAADIYRLEGRIGQGGWTWYTGSAAWMYRVWLEEILGFRLRDDKLIVDPCISSDWPEYKVTYRYKSAEYEISVENPERLCRGVFRVELDGKVQDGAELALVGDGRKHLVRMVLGKRETPKQTKALASRPVTSVK